MTDEELRREAMLLVARELLMVPDDADLPMDVLPGAATSIVMRRQRAADIPRAFLEAFGG